VIPTSLSDLLSEALQTFSDLLNSSGMSSYDPSISSASYESTSIVSRTRPSVKRVVITSSVSAIIEPKDQVPYTFTESDWNEASSRNVERYGAKATGVDKYNASKTLAERAAWAFMSEYYGKIDFDLVCIHPPFIFGPVIHQMKDIDALNQSNALLRKALRSPNPEPGEFLGNFIDVRTVAEAHVKAVQVPEAGGNRFIISAGPFSWQDACRYFSILFRLSLCVAAVR
jgi:nucleoside-diphosphate-sugar epimerase